MDLLKHFTCDLGELFIWHGHCDFSGSKTPTMRILKNLFAPLAVSALLAASAQAASYNIPSSPDLKVAGVGASEIVTMSTVGLDGGHKYRVYAGVLEIDIKNTGIVNGLCIDPYQWADTKTVRTYTTSALEDSVIGKLWALYFDKALTDDHIAAALQVAVWMHVGGMDFQLYYNDELKSLAESYIAAAKSSDIAAARLLRLHHGAKQDYAVLHVPDGGTTVLLLGLGLTGLAIIRRRR